MAMRCCLTPSSVDIVGVLAALWGPDEVRRALNHGTESGWIHGFMEHIPSTTAAQLMCPPHWILGCFLIIIPFLSFSSFSTKKNDELSEPDRTALRISMMDVH